MSSRRKARIQDLRPHHTASSILFDDFAPWANREKRGILLFKRHKSDDQIGVPLCRAAMPR